MRNIYVSCMLGFRCHEKCHLGHLFSTKPDTLCVFLEHFSSLWSNILIIYIGLIYCSLYPLLCWFYFGKHKIISHHVFILRWFRWLKFFFLYKRPFYPHYQSYDGLMAQKSRASAGIVLEYIVLPKYTRVGRRRVNEMLYDIYQVSCMKQHFTSNMY